MRSEVERIHNFFSQRREVAALFLFGSFDTSGEREDSDIDIAVLISPKDAAGINIQELRTEYYNASPSFSMRKVDIVILNAAPTALKFQVLKEGRILFDKHPDLRTDFTARALQEYFDYRPIEEIYFRGVRERLRKAVHG